MALANFRNLLPENSVKRLLDVVLANTDEAVRTKLKRRYGIAIKNIRSTDPNKQAKGHELMITLIQQIRAKELTVEIKATRLDPTDILDILEYVARTAVGLVAALG